MGVLALHHQQPAGTHGCLALANTGRAPGVTGSRNLLGLGPEAPPWEVGLPCPALPSWVPTQHLTGFRWELAFCIFVQAGEMVTGHNWS